MSQPQYPQQPAASAPGAAPPAAPTQIGFPGQVQLTPQPQYAPSPEQARGLQGGPLATGFPGYRSPAPSPKNQTGLIVGCAVVAATVLFAVIGFVLVSGRGANSPEGAVEQFVQQMSERDAEGVDDLLCEPAARETSRREIAQALNLLPPGELRVEVHDMTGATQGGLAGRAVRTTLTFAGQSQESTFFVTEDKGWRVCGGDASFFF